MTQQTAETYDLNTIAEAVKVTPDRARLIISELVKQFGLDATQTPANALVSMVGSIVGLMKTHEISISQATAKYIQSLQEQQKKSGNKSGYAAGSMAETIDNMADSLAEQLAPRVVELASKKLQSKIIDQLIQGIDLIEVEDCFGRVGAIISTEIQEVERGDRFQINGQDSVLSYFKALPLAK